MVIIISSIVAVVVALGAAAIISVNYFVGFPKAVGEVKNSYSTKELHVEFGDINLYGEAFIPNNGKTKHPLIIYAHGANSTHAADYTTIKSLAMSGYATYSFDFYGWSKKSTGPKSGDWFAKTPKSENDAYLKQLSDQVVQLDAVIEKLKTAEFVDTNEIFLLGSSMGGVTVATCAINHTEDIKKIILQYPAINLNPEAMVDNSARDVNKYKNKVLILQGDNDKIVPLKMSQDLFAHYNKYDSTHANMIVYKGQPHVFNGEYKIQAAKDIYAFLK